MIQMTRREYKQKIKKAKTEAVTCVLLCMALYSISLAAILYMFMR